VWTVRDRGPWTVRNRRPSGFGPDRPGPDRLQYTSINWENGYITSLNLDISLNQTDLICLILKQVYYVNFIIKI
jgi:hypothetical protein